MFYGKLVAGLIGLATTGSLVGLLLGVFIGHAFDRGLINTFRFGTPEHLAQVRRLFFQTSFSLLGHLAKADGRVSAEEIQQVEKIMGQLGLAAAEREEAIALFKRGTAADFQLRDAVTEFLQHCDSPPQLRQTLLLFMISLALADHEIHPAEYEVLRKVSDYLGYSAQQFEHLLRMVQAQDSFHGAASRRPRDTAASLQQAYTALGINSEASDRELKRAYRKLMSEHHPDKLIARGVPENMMKLATEKAQEIQAAYELLRKSRKQA